MRLVLTSGGLTTEELVVATERLVGKPRAEISVAIINEGYAVEHDDNLWWVLHDLNKIHENFGGPSELVNLLALTIETIIDRLNKHEVVYVVGGHTDYLMSVFNSSGLSDRLAELLEKKVYVGSSAGSMILCRRTSSAAYQAIYGESDDYDVDHYLRFCDFSIKPHMGSENFPNNTLENLIKASSNFDGKIYGMSDKSAILVDGDDLSFIGPRPCVVLNGEEIDG